MNIPQPNIAFKGVFHVKGNSEGQVWEYYKKVRDNIEPKQDGKDKAPLNFIISFDKPELYFFTGQDAIDINNIQAGKFTKDQNSSVVKDPELFKNRILDQYNQKAVTIDLRG